MWELKTLPVNQYNSVSLWFLKWYVTTIFSQICPRLCSICVKTSRDDLVQFDKVLIQTHIYTLSHPKNDCDVTERANDIRYVRLFLFSLIPGFVFWTDAHDNSIFLWNTRWCHGRSRGETKVWIIFVFGFSGLLLYLLHMTSPTHDLVWGIFCLWI